MLGLQRRKNEKSVRSRSLLPTVMLSSVKSSAAVVKLVDFGSAIISDETSPFHHGFEVFSMTPGYSPPEYIGDEKKGKRLDPSFDMWALGVIIYSKSRSLKRQLGMQLQRNANRDALCLSHVDGGSSI